MSRLIRLDGNNKKCQELFETSLSLGTISATLSCLVYVPRREEPSGKERFFSEQRLVIKPRHNLVNAKPKQNQITLDTQVKNALLPENNRSVNGLT